MPPFQADRIKRPPCEAKRSTHERLVAGAKTSRAWAVTTTCGLSRQRTGVNFQPLRLAIKTRTERDILAGLLQAAEGSCAASSLLSQIRSAVQRASPTTASPAAGPARPRHGGFRQLVRVFALWPPGSAG
jgi:hypothetical protein